TIRHFFVTLVTIVCLVACGQQGQRSIDGTALVSVGFSDQVGNAYVLGSVNSDVALSPFGVPSDPEGGEAVRSATLRVFRSGTEVYFDSSGHEVPEVDSTPIDLAAGQVTIRLQLGQYDFLVSARDHLVN